MLVVNLFYQLASLIEMYHFLDYVQQHGNRVLSVRFRTAGSRPKYEGEDQVGELHYFFLNSNLPDG